jgi:DNA-binding transcriptional regulator GbsR (MarR family)
MGRSWGVSRTVAQIFALLYIAAEPIPAETIMETLNCSRSNVSIGLKELQRWRLAKLHRIPGDRHEYFSAPEDCAQIFRLIAEERKRREIDPLNAALRELTQAAPESEDDRRTQSKLRDMHALMQIMTAWFETIQTPMDQAPMREPLFTAARTGT